LRCAWMSFFKLARIPMKVLPQIAARLLLPASFYMAGPHSSAQETNTNIRTSPAPAADSAPVLQLDELVKQAIERNPEAQSAEHTVQALTHRVPQARALPDPTVGVGWAGSLVPFKTMSGDASSYRGITVSQQFPTA